MGCCHDRWFIIAYSHDLTSAIYNGNNNVFPANYSDYWLNKEQILLDLNSMHCPNTDSETIEITSRSNHHHIACISGNSGAKKDML